jgi:putative membrane protein
MVTWFAGLFYLFRLFVYHVENTEQKHTIEIFRTMEYKLYYYITWPSMLGTITFGTLLIFSSGHNITDGWLSLKLLLVSILVLYHFFIGYVLKRFRKDDYFLSSTQCRIANEFPTLILISVILIAVYKHVF